MPLYPLLMMFLMNPKQSETTLTVGCLGAPIHIFHDRNFRNLGKSILNG